MMREWVVLRERVVSEDESSSKGKAQLASCLASDKSDIIIVIQKERKTLTFCPSSMPNILPCFFGKFMATFFIFDSCTILSKSTTVNFSDAAEPVGSW